MSNPYSFLRHTNSELIIRINMDQPQDSPVMRLYVDGVFDCTHYAHFKLFEQCKSKFPRVHLIVGVAGDDDCSQFKAKTIMPEFERAENIRHCRWVDEVICPCPWVITELFLNEHRIDYVCHDDAPYTHGSESGDIYAHIKQLGKFLATERTQGVSTTDMVRRVLC